MMIAKRLPKSRLKALKYIIQSLVKVLIKYTHVVFSQKAHFMNRFEQISDREYF